MMRLFFLFLVLLCSSLVHAKSSSPTPFDTVCVVNDGDTATFGPWYIDPINTWEKRFAEWEKYRYLLHHNPAGHRVPPMRLDQFSRLKFYAGVDPDNEQAQAQADFVAYTSAAKKRTDAGLWYGGYFGGSATMPAKPGETPRQWANRVLLELKPFLDANPDYICFDAEKESSAPGNGMSILISELRAKGIEVAIEPCTYVDYTPYHSLGIVITDKYWFSREYTSSQRAELSLPGAGDSLWNTGSHAARPLRRVSLHPRVLRFIDPTDRQRFIDISRQDKHVPCVKWLDLHYNKVKLPTAASVESMTNLTTRGFFESPLAGTSIVDQPTLQAYSRSVVLNPELKNYDASGTSFATYFLKREAGKPPTWAWTHSVPCTLISAKYAISGDHNYPKINDVVWFRTPEGTARAATVVSDIILPYTTCHLLQLDRNPSGKLARYPISSDESFTKYIANGGKPAWLLDQNQTIRLRNLISLVGSRVYHTNTSWNNELKSGSGRPAFVPMNNNELVITGILTAPSSNNRISLEIGIIKSLLEQRGESLRVVDITN